MKLRGIVLVLALLSVLSTVTAGYLYYRFAEKAAGREAEEELVSRTERLKERLEQLIARVEAQARVLGGFEELKTALGVQSRESLFQANRILDHFARALEYDMCYLMDSTGTIIASSNRSRPDSSVGKNYSFRPYFKAAMKGHPSVYLALGVTSGKRGMYFNSPVYDKDKKRPIGVSAVKVTIEAVEREISRGEKGIALLVHKSGLVFASSHGQWLLQRLWPVSPEAMGRIAEERQFGGQPRSWIGLEKRPGNKAVDKAGEEYFIQELSLDSLPGWRIVYLQSLNTISRRLTHPFVKSTWHIAIILAFLVTCAASVLYAMAHRDIQRRKRAEEALRESEERYRNVYRTAPLAFVIWDRNCLVTDWNNQSKRIFGWSKREVLGKNFFEFLIPEKQRPQVERIVQGLLRGEVPGRGVSENLTKSGETILREWNNSVLRDRKGNVVGAISLALDVTDRQRTEEALKESEIKYRSLFEDSRDGIFSMERDGTLTDCNQSFLDMFGYPREEILGKSVARLYVNPADREKFQQVIEEKGTVKDYHVRLLKKNGTEIDCLLTAAVKRGSDGRIKGYHGLMRDVTEQRRLQQEIQLEREQLLSIFDGINEAIYVSDPNTYEVLYMNKFVKDTFGEDSVGGLCYKVFQGLNSPCDFCTNEIIQANDGEPYEWEHHNALSNRDYLVTDRLVKWPDGRDVRFEFAIDITDRKKTEEALNASQSRLMLALQGANLGMWDWDLTTGRAVWTERTHRMLGYEPGEIEPNVKNWKKLVHHEDWPSVSEVLNRHIGGLTSLFEAEHRIRTKSGNWLWSLARGQVVEFDSNNRPTRMAGVIVDISERKKAEEELARTKALLTAAIEQSPAGILIADAPDVKIRVANSAALSIRGESLEPLTEIAMELHPTHWQIFHPDGTPFAPEELPLSQAVLYGKTTRNVEAVIRRKDGENRWILANAAPVRDETGRVVAGVFVFPDISDRKHTEEELQRLFTAVEQAGEAILVTDAAGTILYVNPAFETITGYSRGEVLGKNPRILKSEQQDAAFYAAMWRTLTSGRIWRGQLTNRRKDGTLFEEKATISPIKNERGEIVNYVAVKRDVTSEVSLQEQLLQAQKMEAIGTLAGGIAHDFNNLLMIILGYADLLVQRKQPDDPDREKLEAMRRAAKDGADLVNRILTFSKRVESKVRPIDLNEEIRRIEKLMIRMLPKMIQVQLVLQEDLRIVNADPAQIEQIVLNLSVNAHHAMPEGGRLIIETSNVTLREDYCRLHLDAKPGEHVLLSVSDTGTGIEPEILDRIFEPFFTTKQDTQGTGLGLSMVHGIVAQHGGHIRCYSQPGLGTTFKIYFPAVKREVESDQAMTTEMPAFGTETILLVDDDIRIRDLAAEILMLAGYDVVNASNGQEALQIYRDRKDEISLVILDLIMPGMSGNQCLKELLRVDPQVKVLISSGYSANGPTKDITGRGARGLITKPYDMHEMLRAIRGVIDADD